MQPNSSHPPATSDASAVGDLAAPGWASRWDELESAPAPPLQTAECHIWSLTLQQPESRRARLEATLSQDEIQRANAFLLPAPRQQFVTCRGALRTLLGAYLTCAPTKFRFTLNPFGKPGLAEPPSNLCFNVSHAGSQALIAIARNVDVGIDIEVHRDLDDIAGLARMIFCSRDLEQWSALSPPERVAAFYRAWTRKEAVAKAIGCGLALDFPALRVSFVVEQPAAILEMDPATGYAYDWTLENIATGIGYSAAIAAATKNLRICRYDL